MHFLFIKNVLDIATEEVMTENYIFALRFTGCSEFVSHHYEFSCRFALPALCITDILPGIFVKVLRLRDSITFLENSFPIVSDYKVTSGYKVTHWLCRSQCTSSSSCSCSVKNVFQETKMPVTGVCD